MMQPLEFGPGLIFDARVVMLSLAGAYGGWISGAIAMVIAAAYRLSEGGIGATAGVLGIFIAGTIGIVFGRILDKPYRLSDHGALGILASLQILSIFVLPWDLAVDVLQRVGLLLAVINLIGVLIVGSFLKWEESRELTAQKMKLDADIDFLTKLSNRRKLDDIANSLDACSSTKKLNISIIMFDIDHFKKLNDKYGHAVGDKVLEEIADRIRNSFRRHDEIFRYGGEEFVVVLTNVKGDEAIQLAERVRIAVQEEPINCDGLHISLTLSAGVAISEGTSSSFNTLLETADKALYQAKNTGRNRVDSINTAVFDQEYSQRRIKAKA